MIKNSQNAIEKYTHLRREDKYITTLNLLPGNNQPGYLQLHFYDSNHEIENHQLTCPRLRWKCHQTRHGSFVNQLQARFFRMLRKLNFHEHTWIITEVDAMLTNCISNIPTTSSSCNNLGWYWVPFQRKKIRYNSRW